MDKREKAIRLRLKVDFPHYAEKALKIRLKKPRPYTGGGSGAPNRLVKIAPFLFNTAQSYLHQRLEAQKASTGKVRALLLKGRQQGCSTYVGGRFYHITSHRKGIKTFILAHRDTATNNLFQMVKRYHLAVPTMLRPHTSHSSRRELVFDILDSAYSLGTAGSGDIGRSDTIDLLHGSEVAFWTNTDEIKTGVMQAAEAAEEIILESTANGLGNMFHAMWQDAEAGLSQYEAIFIPWYWQEEYRSPVPEGFVLDAEEVEYMTLYGLDLGQMAWRRQKLIDLKDPLLFKQEYPATASEAFQTTGVDSFIKPEAVVRARKARNIRQAGAHVVGVDPARGGDNTALIHRQGLVAWGLKTWKTPDTLAIVGHITEVMTDERPGNFVDRLFIDVGGLGGPIYDILKEMPYARRITPINFGSTDCYDKERYKNRRAEMYGVCRDWLEDTTEQCSIPDSDLLHTDLCAPGYKYDLHQRIFLESKEDMKARGLRSNDSSDALVLTHAMPVQSVLRDIRTGHKAVRKPFAL